MYHVLGLARYLSGGTTNCPKAGRMKKQFPVSHETHYIASLELLCLRNRCFAIRTIRQFRYPNFTYQYAVLSKSWCDIPSTRLHFGLPWRWPLFAFTECLDFLFPSFLQSYASLRFWQEQGNKSSCLKENDVCGLLACYPTNNQPLATSPIEFESAHINL